MALFFNCFFSKPYKYRFTTGAPVSMSMFHATTLGAEFRFAFSLEKKIQFSLANETTTLIGVRTHEQLSVFVRGLKIHLVGMFLEYILFCLFPKSWKKGGITLIIAFYLEPTENRSKSSDMVSRSLNIRNYEMQYSKHAWESFQGTKSILRETCGNPCMSKWHEWQKPILFHHRDRSNSITHVL